MNKLQPNQTSNIDTKIVVSIVIVVLIVIGIGGYFFWQNQNTTVKDSTETTTTTEPTTTTPSTPKTEIKVKGQNATLVISPSVDKAVKGTVTLTVTDVPSETKAIFFTITEGGVKANSPNLGIDSDGIDGWSRIVDTTKYPNGVYEIAALPTITGDGNPLGRAVTQVEIKN